MSTFVRVSPARRGFLPVLLLLILSFVTAASRPLQAQPPQPRLWLGGTTLVDVEPYGMTPAAMSGVGANAVSADGRFVVFVSSASTLVPGDTNGVADVFLRDRQTNQTTRVSVSSGGDQANGESGYPSVSANGRFVTFASAASNLVEGDENGATWDVFVYDRVSRTLTLVSRNTYDAPSDGDSTVSAISDDGRFVAFISTSNNFESGIEHPGQLFLRDRDLSNDGALDESADVMTRAISVSSDEVFANAAVTGTIDITPDGRYIAFASIANNLVPDDTNGSIDVFVRDRVASYTSRVSVTSHGTETFWKTGTSWNPSLTPDGRFVVFESAAHLTNDDYNDATDIILHDVQTAETTRVNYQGGGAYGPYNNRWPSISDDGRYVAYEAGEPNRGFDSYQDAFVVDRQTNGTYVVNQDPNGLRMGPIVTHPWISGDGSTVVFRHLAIDGSFANVYAAVDFAVTPTQSEFNAAGAEQVFTITTTPTTGWRVVPEQPWITPVDGTNRAGSGTLRVKLTRNGTDGPRFGWLKIGPHSVEIVQPHGMKVQSVFPQGGSTNGSESVRINGSGFFGNAAVNFGGVPALVETVWYDSITVITPPHVAGLVDVQVINGDGDTLTLANAYTYASPDTTPPVIQPIVTGPLGNNGWYTGNVTLTWSITDPESAMISATGCEPVTQTVDTYTLTPITCTATSGGGTGSASYTIKRDTAPPSWSVQAPQPTIYPKWDGVLASYSCADPFTSGMASCIGTVPNGSALDLSTPGYHEFTVTATDLAGLQSTGLVTYAVSTGVCTAPPADLVSWWPADGHTNDVIGLNRAVAFNGAFTNGYNPYGIGMVGAGSTTAFRFGCCDGLSSVNFGQDASLTMTTAFSVAAWVKATNTGSNNGVIIKKSGEYGLAIANNNYLAYYFGSNTATPTSYFIPRNVWTHVAMTYDAGVLTIYANGRVVTTANVAATLVDAVPAYNGFMVGGSQESHAGMLPSFVGLIDEVQVYRRALASAELESIFLSGAAGVCAPPASTLTMSPVYANFEPIGSTTLTQFTARLRTAAGVGVPGRTVSFTLSGSTVGSAVTNGSGYATVEVNLAGKNAGMHTNAIGAAHLGDATLQSSSATATLTIQKANSYITWPTPEPVTYGATMGAAQMTATANVPGAFTYYPRISTPFNAGPQTLRVDFAPYDSTNYFNSTAYVTLDVRPATPTLTVNAGTFTYDKTPHPATWAAIGIHNEVLPVTVKYNGSTTPPVNAGSYTVVATVNAPNYAVTTQTASTPLVITPATPTVTVNAGTYVYNGSTREATASASGVGGEALTPVTLTYNGSSAKPSDAGTYTVVATYAGSQNYAATSVTAATPLTIEQATPTVTVQPASFNYDGTPHAATVSATGVGGAVLTPVDVTYNGSAAVPVDAGDYTVIASFAGSQNYAAASSAPVTLTIRKASPQLSSITTGTFTYDATPHAATATATGIGGVALTPVTITYNGDTTAPTNAGTYTVVASLAATTNYEAASSTASSPLIIRKATPTVQITGDVVTYDGNPHALTATATGVAGEALTPVTITYDGNTTAPVAAGTYSVVASYAGSDNYEPASKPTSLGITKAQPTISWTPAAAIYGTPLGAAQLNASASVAGTWTYSRPAGTVLHAGSYATEASFTPADAVNYGPASTTATIVIVPAPLTIKADDQVKVFGAAVPVLTIGYIGLVNGDTPATLASVLSLATTATAASAIGTYPITAVWGSAVNDYTYTFVPGVLTVQAAATATTVTSSANPSGVNQPITFTATVGVIAPGAGQPTGTVTFSNGSTVLGTATLQNGAASLTTGLATGTHAISVTYSGDASFVASQGTLTQTVKASSGSTTTTVTSSLNPSRSGQSVTLTGRVTSAAGTPTGQVQFFDGDDLIGTSTLSTSGTATLTTTALAVGSHPIMVRYLGSASLPPSRSTTLVQVVNTTSVNKKSTSLSASASPSTGTYGNESAFTVTVMPPLFQSAPTGNVRFEIDGVWVTIVALSQSGRNGVATLRTSALPRGTHRIACTYLGSSSYAGSTSTITYVVN
jgi:Concanavalin A-like lectin/glucanases superfamily/Bacterial Ig-like domain (group 3)/MBG domain (YGX type)/IPT/TIG domain/MBG domain/WD40-like Beta Propeller Repeat